MADTTAPVQNYPGYTNIPEELRKALKDVLDAYDNEEKYVREGQLRELKRADDFWHGLQYSIWDDAIGDFRSPSSLLNESGVEQDINPNVFNKIKNIYKAHGESTIAALTTGLPYVRYFPDNAEDANDIQTAKAYSKIEEQIQRHNQAQLIFIHSLFILFNQSFVAAYNYPHQDKKYGQIQVPVEGQQTVTTDTHYCPECGAEIGTTQSTGDATELSPETEQAELVIPEAGPESLNTEGGDPNLAANAPDLLSAPVQPQAAPGMNVDCPNCGANVDTYVEQATEQVPTVLRYEDIDKTRECIEVYGPLNVVIPHYVKEMKHSPYLRLDGSCHISYAREMWPHIADKIQPDGDTTKYDAWARISTAYSGEVPKGLVSVRRLWIRNWGFSILNGESNAANVQELKKLFPQGCYAVFVNDEFAEAYDEDLDSKWSVTVNPLSNHIHADPIGKSLMPIQEVINELLNLNIQSIQYGIPETFADPEVLDFPSYQKVEAGAGLVFPAKPASGKSMQDAFFTNKVATLSKESMEFSESLNQDAQFVSGSFPSIYGGPQSGGGQTAAEYSMSRAQALQRLGLTWKVLSLWWAQVMSKAVSSYANNMMTDENFVKQQGDSYVNVWIRKVELEGKVGQVQPDVDEQFPTSWAQKREVLLDLIKMGNDEINQFLFLPSNRTQISTLIGLSDLEVPGELDMNRQLAEIMEMLQAAAVMPPMDENGQPVMDPNTGMPMQGMSSVPADQDLDDHEIHADTCKSWLISDVGQELKKRAPEIYMNIFLHFKEHVTIIQQQQAAQQEQEKEMAQFQSGLKQQEKQPTNNSGDSNE
jgi:hypothetical protein